MDKKLTYYERNKAKCLEYQKQYNNQNRDRINKNRRRDNQKYYQKNKDKILEQQKQYHKQYWQSNKEKLLIYTKEYNKIRKFLDINYKLACNLRSRLSIAVKHNQKVGSAVADLGCSIEFFKSYIEQKFQTGMSWENYGEWHLDHIIPLASFDLTNTEQFLNACYYTNYQPLWAEDNLKKYNKMGAHNG